MRFAGVRAVWITKWSWPFGGGEEAFYANLQWATSEGMQIYWLSFADSQNKPFAQLRCIASFPVAGADHKQSKLLQVPGGWETDNIVTWLRLLRPAFLHHQGNLKAEIQAIALSLRIPLLSGFHFWHGALQLSQPTYNAEILANADKHQADPLWDSHLEAASLCYVASEFMVECIERITGRRVDHICYPLSEATIQKPRKQYRHFGGDMITMVNVHANKGGQLLLHLLHEPRLQHLSFCAIRTEHLSEELDQQLESAIASRQAPSLWLGRQADMQPIYEKTGVLLVPSMVDETFCRVALEGLYHGIPMISTGAGNIKNLLTPDTTDILPITELEAWTQSLLALTGKPKLYSERSHACTKRAQHFSVEVAKQQIFSAIDVVLGQPKRIALLSPWCDQGLGIQSRNYAKALASEGWEVSIFAMRPYFAKNADDRHQANPTEWEWPAVYYSPNVREEISDSELLAFVMEHRIRYALLPETCWYRVFEIGQYLRRLGVQCYAIPNFEILRKSELWKHDVFPKILCNNNTCRRIFLEHGFPADRLPLVGYANPPIEVPIRNFNQVKMLFLGGMNAFTRKQAVPVYNAFILALAREPELQLTMCIQDMSRQEDIEWFSTVKENAPEQLTFVQRHLSDEEVQDFYRESTAVIQVSRHEGLGLSFFEALDWAIPVLTLDHVPHNEIIQHGITGLIIPCSTIPMTDNDDAFTQSAIFKEKDLADAMCELAKPKRLKHLLKSCQKYQQHNHYGEFVRRFSQAL